MTDERQHNPDGPGWYRETLKRKDRQIQRLEARVAELEARIAELQNPADEWELTDVESELWQ